MDLQDGNTRSDSADIDSKIGLGRVFAPAFVRKERELDEFCNRWGVEYEPPLDVENLSSLLKSKQATYNRRARIRKMIKMCSDPVAHVAAEKNNKATTPKPVPPPNGEPAKRPCRCSLAATAELGERKAKRRRGNGDGEGRSRGQNCGHTCMCGQSSCQELAQQFESTDHPFKRPLIHFRVPALGFQEKYMPWLEALLRHLQVPEGEKARFKALPPGKRLYVAAHHFTPECVLEYFGAKTKHGVYKVRLGLARAKELLGYTLDPEDEDGSLGAMIAPCFPFGKAQQLARDVRERAWMMRLCESGILENGTFRPFDEAWILTKKDFDDSRTKREKKRNAHLSSVLPPRQARDFYDRMEEGVGLKTLYIQILKNDKRKGRIDSLAHHKPKSVKDSARDPYSDLSEVKFVVVLRSPTLVYTAFMQKLDVRPHFSIPDLERLELDATYRQSGIEIVIPENADGLHVAENHGAFLYDRILSQALNYFHYISYATVRPSIEDKFQQPGTWQI
ncbi:hypothetical protein THAOC_16640 [Thalassiosira oceanica]|uniref:Uncharacterized protein n=1 Tax=Thalassiosira oceanica TaxID=159749 RepID=K0SX14_THAOC|nr:hypothetical protein THAOC_16640 [Thalassiosira oceanica]|eukprot:EJK62737.1 hypothetical protein THAOC_16640 [Thalassiosira oceanica]